MNGIKLIVLTALCLEMNEDEFELEGRNVSFLFIINMLKCGCQRR